jgi:hypothetical protein
LEKLVYDVMLKVCLQTMEGGRKHLVVWSE